MNTTKEEREALAIFIKVERVAAERGHKAVEEIWLAIAERLSSERDNLEAEVARLREQKDGAYAERDKCVASIAVLAAVHGCRAGLGRHVGDDWDDEWRNIVFIDLPSGQVSWHIHDSELPWFTHLQPYPGEWDGHDTAEKYRRAMAPFGYAAVAGGSK